MKTLIRTLLFGSVLALVGCGADAGRLKGTVVDGGKVVGSEGQQVSLSFYAMKPDGTADAGNCSTAVLNADGSFEFIASGGTLPPGKYKVVIASVGSAEGPPTLGKEKKKKSEKPVDRFAGHSTLATTKLMVTVEPGKNEVVLDLAKPTG